MGCVNPQKLPCPFCDALASLKSSLHPYIDQNGNLYVTSQIYVDRMANKDLKWERTASYNIGLDFSLLNDRMRGSMETYMTETTDLLVNRALPSILGFSSVKANLGKLANKGFELSIKRQPYCLYIRRMSPFAVWR